MGNEKYVKDTGFVLKLIPYKDNDVHLIFFGKKEGKIRITARGVRKSNSKQSAFLSVGACLDVELIDGKAGFILSSCSQLQGYIQRYSCYEALLTSVYFCDLVDKGMAASVVQDSVYVLLELCLSAMSDKNFIEVRLFFEWGFLALLGFGSSLPEDFLQSIHGHESDKESDRIRQSCIDEIQTFLSASTNPRCLSVLHLSKMAAGVMHQVLARAYQNNAQIFLKSKKVLDEATAHFYS